MITEEGFLISPCYSVELCIQMDMSFLSLLAIFLIAPCYSLELFIQMGTAICSQQTEDPRNQWSEFQPKSKGLRTRRADDSVGSSLSLSPKAGEDQGPSQI